ncbi:hypothetical protein JEZ13_05490 [bacterium]|nr:hypothetical protein [bacterium]
MKKLIIISLFIFSSLCLNAYYWNQTRISFYKSHDTEVYGGENNFMSELIIDKLNFRFQMNSLVSEEGFDDPNSYVTNEIRSLSTYQLAENSKFILGYNLDYYDYDKTQSSFIYDWINQPVQPLVKNYLYLISKNEWDNFTLLAGLRGRATGIDYKFDISDAINTAQAEHYDEFYKDLALAYKLTNNVAIYATFENKTFYSSNADFNDPGRDYDYTHYGGGVNFTSKNFLGGKFSEDFQYLRKDSKQYADYQRHNFINKLRYNYIMTPALSSFVSYISKFSYDDKEKEFYRLANMVRVQARYNLLNYNYQAFLIAGTSLSLENLNRIYFAYVNYPINKSFAISLEDRYSHNVYNTIIASLDYRLNSNFMFYIENSNSQSFSNINIYDFKNTLTIGTRMLFR